MKKPKRIPRKTLIQDARDLYLNGHRKPSEIADLVGRSPRTVYRWLNVAPSGEMKSRIKHPPSKSRAKQYPSEIFEKIETLKREAPKRTAPQIELILRKLNYPIVPSASTIRKFIALKGLSEKPTDSNQGYIVFQREFPNDLWQIDIAGVQRVEGIGNVYLFAVLDDCSRYVVSAFYALNEQGIHVMRLIQIAFMTHGRPNQILADNGTQFKNTMGDLNTKYSRLLATCGVEAIFARPRHPQTKGKLERFFGTVASHFIVEMKADAKIHPGLTIADLNTKFDQWREWYNHEKPHRSLPNQSPPATVYFDSPKRLFRPLESEIDWSRWTVIQEDRKVTKCNEIHYNGQIFAVPPGYSGNKVEIREDVDKIEIFHGNNFLISHPYSVFQQTGSKSPSQRIIGANGTIGYNGHYYTVDYKLHGKKVTIEEVEKGSLLLVKMEGKLLKTLPKEN